MARNLPVVPPTAPPPYAMPQPPAKTAKALTRPGEDKVTKFLATDTEGPIAGQQDLEGRQGTLADSIRQYPRRLSDLAKPDAPRLQLKGKRSLSSGGRR